MLAQYHQNIEDIAPATEEVPIFLEDHFQSKCYDRERPACISQRISLPGGQNL